MSDETEAAPSGTDEPEEKAAEHTEEAAEELQQAAGEVARAAQDEGSPPWLTSLQEKLESMSGQLAQITERLTVAAESPAPEPPEPTPSEPEPEPSSVPNMERTQVAVVPPPPPSKPAKHKIPRKIETRRLFS